MAKSPNWDRSYTECFGFTLENLGEAGAKSIEQKLRAIGLPVDDLLRFPMPMDLPPREWALRGQKMLRAGLLRDGEDSVVNAPRRPRSCSTRSAAPPTPRGCRRT